MIHTADQRRRPRRAFTLLEVLIAVAVIVILVGIVFVSFRSIDASSRGRSTRASLENLRALMTEFEASARDMGRVEAAYLSLTTPSALTPGDPLAAPSKLMSELTYSGNPTDDNHAVYRTRYVMAVLRSVPNNKRSLEQISPEQIFTFEDFDTADGDQAPVPVIKDAWGNPIIYVPGDLPGTTPPDHRGLANVSRSGLVSPFPDIEAPDHRAFWASAGPDGRFTDPTPDDNPNVSYGDDNLYSFEN